MIALLPITRFKVDYEIALGRPFSEFDRLLLEAVASGAPTLEALQTIFRVHKRVLIEGLVTLMHEGWITIGDEGEFSATRSGAKAVTSPNTLPRTLAIEPRADFVIMERLGGQVARRGAVVYHEGRKLSSLRDVSVRLPAGDTSPNLDPSVVAPLVMRDSGGWIRWVKSVTPIRRTGDYVVLSADLEKETVSGLPREWEALLSEEILAYLRRKQPEAPSLSKSQERDLEDLLSASSTVDASKMRDDYPAGEGDVLLRSVQGSSSETITAGLSQAERHIVIAAQSLDPDVCKGLLGPIAEAANRGVRIDIIYTGGTPTSDDCTHAIEVLRKAAYSYSQPSRNVARLTFATSSRAPINCILLHRHDGYLFQLHSHSVLGQLSPGAYSLDVTHAGIVSEIAQILADLYSYGADVMAAPAVVRLRTAASIAGERLARLIDNEQPIGTHARVGLIHKTQLFGSLCENVAQAQSVLSVTVPCIPLNAASVFRILSRAIVERAVHVVVNSAAPEDTELDPSIVEEYLKLGGELRKAETNGLSWVRRDHAEIMVGTYNWLSPPDLDTGQNLNSVAVRVSGDEAFLTPILRFLDQLVEGRRTS